MRRKAGNRDESQKARKGQEEIRKDTTTHATTSSLGPSLAGPISLLVVNPLAPRPSPATYDAGAGMERKASLFLGSLDAMFEESWGVVDVGVGGALEVRWG